MNKITKKIGIMILGVSLLAVSGTVQGATVEELQAQIAALTAQLAALQSQLVALGGTSTTGAPAACAGITFSQNLSQGSTGNDVKCLQALLNQSAVTQVAASGVGSPGNETTYFGPLTAAAVSKFQETYASEILTPLGLTNGTGFVGSATRAKLNTMLTTGTTPTTPTTPSGGEGSIIGTIAASPASGAKVYIGQTDVPVGAINVKAVNSDVRVDRLDILLDTRPWLYLSSVTVSDGTVSKTVSVTQSNSTEITVASSYMFRIDGLNINVPKDTVKVLTVKVTGILPAGETTKAIILTFNTNAVRGTDGAGISQYAPTGVLATRTFTVQTGDTAALEVSANADNPKARNILVQETAVTQGVTLLRADVKAKNNDAILRSVSVALGSHTTGISSVLYLYDGDTLLGSTSTAATSRFDNLSLRITKDTTKTLVVKADILAQSGNYVVGSSSTSTLPYASSSLVAEDAATFAAVNVTGSDVLGAQAYVYLKAPSIALVSQSMSAAFAPAGSTSTLCEANGEIKIRITANGGDIYIAPYASDQASSGISATTTATLASTTYAMMSFTTDAEMMTNAYKIPSGTYKDFTFTARLRNGPGGSAGWYYLSLANVKWAITDAATATSMASYTTQTWGLTDLKTGQVFLAVANN